MSRLKVAISVSVLPGLSGGVAVAVKNLLEGLGALTDGDEEYVVVAHGEEQREWLATFPARNQRIVLFEAKKHNGIKGLMIRAMRPTSHYFRKWLDKRLWPEVPLSSGFYESLGCDVLHIPTQNYFLCSIPTIYNPHDLQHLQYPQFFSRETLAWRETIYPAGCHFSRTVVAGSQWIKDDVVSRYGVDPAKVRVIPEAAPTQTDAKPPTEADIQAIRRKLNLDGPFALYPSVTWPHKNHLNLFRALAYLRDRHGMVVRLVCTGAPYQAHWPRIQESIRELGLSQQVIFAGFVSETELRALYRSATGLVFPSLYEASSLPIFEAWLDGLPVASSNATALPQQVLDAALLFDPRDVTAMGDAIATLMSNPRVQDELRRKGHARLKDFDPERTARAYRAVYRQAADVPLSDEDRWLLKWNWATDPGLEQPTQRARTHENPHRQQPLSAALHRRV